MPMLTMVKRAQVLTRSWVQIALAILCIAYGMALVIRDVRPTIELSTDVIEYISASQDLLNYKSEFHGPGFSIAVFLLSKLLFFLPLHIVARLVSSLAALVGLMAVYALGRRLWNDDVAGLLAAAGLAFNPQYWLSATWALSDMLASTLMVLSALNLWRAWEGKKRAALWAGVAAGAAYITRYICGYALLGAAAVAFLIRPVRFPSRLRDLGWFILGWLIPSFPWLIRSHYLYGNPFWSINYLDTASKLLGGTMRGGGLAYREQFPSLFSVIAYDPKAFFSNWALSLVSLPLSIVQEFPFVGHLALVGLLVAGLRWVWRRSSGATHLFIVHLVIVAYAVLVSTVWPHPRLWLPLFAFATLYLGALSTGIREVIRRRPTWNIAGRCLPTTTAWAIIAPIVIAGGVLWATPKVLGLIDFMNKTNPEPHEYGAIAECLKNVSGENNAVFSTAPHIPYLAGRKRVEPAASVVQSFSTVKDLSAWLHRDGVDYLVVESRLGKWRLPNLGSSLLSLTSSEAAASGLEPVCLFHEPPASVYRVTEVALASTSMTPLGPYQIGEHILLNGYGLQPPKLEAGSELKVTLYWQALQALRENHIVFVHLVNSNGITVAKHEGIPQLGGLPTTLWKPGRLIMDTHPVSVPKSLLAGPYHLEVGMYAVGTKKRIPVINLATGEGTERNSAIIPLGP